MMETIKSYFLKKLCERGYHKYGIHYSMFTSPFLDSGRYLACNNCKKRVEDDDAFITLAKETAVRIINRLDYKK